MGQHGTRRWVFFGTLMVIVMAMVAVPLDTRGASQFATPAFQGQWESVERVIPNFWGPLATARDGQIEPYVEGNVNGDPGKRLVQYFDKARMELTNPATGIVTNGLLTVELKSGQLQLGDNTFEGRQPAQIGIAGDPGSPGPTYGTLSILPEREARRTGSVSLVYDLGRNSFFEGAASGDPRAAFATYLGDPNGRFGQNVPRAFADFLERIPGGYLSAMGYPISPAFQATVTLNGQAGVPVIIQAFQRKVLTYTPGNPDAFKVEFGNIGQHYYQWRYATPVVPVTDGAPVVVVVPVVPVFYPGKQPTATSTTVPTQTPVVVTATPTATTAPTQTPVVVTATPTATATATTQPTGTALPQCTVTLQRADVIGFGTGTVIGGIQTQSQSASASAMSTVNVQVDIRELGRERKGDLRDARLMVTVKPTGSNSQNSVQSAVATPDQNGNITINVSGSATANAEAMTVQVQTQTATSSGIPANTVLFRGVINTPCILTA